MSYPDYPDVLRQFDYLERAEQFYQAFGDLPQRPPPAWPRYFMLCHAIELALKAYLAAHGATAQQLKDFRHNFTALLNEAINKGLLKPVFVIEHFQSTARELLNSVSNAVRGSETSLFLR
jgi:hypothetical protein